MIRSRVFRNKERFRKKKKERKKCRIGFISQTSNSDLLLTNCCFFRGLIPLVSIFKPFISLCQSLSLFCFFLEPRKREIRNAEKLYEDADFQVKKVIIQLFAFLFVTHFMQLVSFYTP